MLLPAGMARQIEQWISPAVMAQAGYDRQLQLRSRILRFTVDGGSRVARGLDIGSFFLTCDECPISIPPYQL